jgi:hypothetical protein
MALAARAHTQPAPDPRSLRDALGRFATGVAFVTAAPDGQPAGPIVNSLASVSLEPPLISFCPRAARSPGSAWPRGHGGIPAFRFVLAGWRSRSGRCGSPAFGAT